MADYLPDLIRLANAAYRASDFIVDNDEAEKFWKVVEELPAEVRALLDNPVHSAEEWAEILGPVLDEDVTSDLYHVEPT